MIFRIRQFPNDSVALFYSVVPAFPLGEPERLKFLAVPFGRFLLSVPRYGWYQQQTVRYEVPVLLPEVREVPLFEQKQRHDILFLSFRSETVNKQSLSGRFLIFRKPGHKQTVHLKPE